MNKESTTEAVNRETWRNWLEKNHNQKESVWLILYKKGSDIESVQVEEAIEEALCFGWIDSKPNKRDDESYYLFFARRKEKSNWSRLNKTRVERLMADGKMAPAGLEMVKIAKSNGTWTALDGVENLEVPEDLLQAFEAYPKSAANFNAFPRSAKRGILEWILNAKRAETRAKRVEETARLAAENIRANQWPRK